MSLRALFSEHCWTCFYAAGVPLKRHRKLLLRWDWEHNIWAIDQWKRVIWSDEPRFVFHLADGHVRINRLLGKPLLPQCTESHTQPGIGGIMF